MNRLIAQLLDTSLQDIARRVKSVAVKVGDSTAKQSRSTIPQSNSTKFSGNLVCGKGLEDYRDFQRVEAVANWAQERDVCFEIIQPEAFDTTSWVDVNAIWMPFINPGETRDYETRCKELLNVPQHVALILDIKSHADHPWLKPIKEYLRERRLGCRYVSPHDTGDFFEVKVQYSHFPVDLPHSDVKDVIMIDIHHWEELSRHIQVLGLLEEFGKSYETACKIAQCKLKFFLTSFTPLEPYLATIDNFIESSKTPREHFLNVIRDNLIVPAETREDFLRVLSRTRLFVTLHRNLTDMDLFQTLANEIPTAILPSSLFEKTVRNLWVPDRNRIPGYESWVHRVEENLIDLQGTDFSFLERTWPFMNSREILRNVFYHSWDTLWKWVIGVEARDSVKNPD